MDGNVVDSFDEEEALIFGFRFSFTVSSSQFTMPHLFLKCRRPFVSLHPSRIPLFNILLLNFEF